MISGGINRILTSGRTENNVEMIKKAMSTRDVVNSLALSSPIMDEDIETEFVGSSTKIVV